MGVDGTVIEEDEVEARRVELLRELAGHEGATVPASNDDNVLLP